MRQVAIVGHSERLAMNSKWSPVLSDSTVTMRGMILDFPFHFSGLERKGRFVDWFRPFIVADFRPPNDEDCCG